MRADCSRLSPWGRWGRINTLCRRVFKQKFRSKYAKTWLYFEKQKKEKYKNICSAGGSVPKPT